MAGRRPWGRSIEGEEYDGVRYFEDLKLEVGREKRYGEENSNKTWVPIFGGHLLSIVLSASPLSRPLCLSFSRSLSFCLSLSIYIYNDIASTVL